MAAWRSRSWGDKLRWCFANENWNRQADTRPDNVFCCLNQLNILKSFHCCTYANQAASSGKTLYNHTCRHGSQVAKWHLREESVFRRTAAPSSLRLDKSKADLGTGIILSRSQGWDWDFRAGPDQHCQKLRNTSVRLRWMEFCSLASKHQGYELPSGNTCK